MNRVAPHDLSVVQALASHARVRAVVVVVLLSHPHLHRVPAAQDAIALGQVLAVGPSRVLEVAVASPLLGVLPSVSRNRRVPSDRADPDFSTGGIVLVDEVLMRVLRHRDAGDGAD